MTRGRTALLATAVGLALAVPASAEAELRFQRCEQARCAWLSVPLDHSRAVPGRLSLRVERHASFDRPKRGVTLVLAGRPGFAGTRLDEYAWQAEGRDVIFFDQRGTGRDPLRCRDLEAATTTDAGREAAACATLLGGRRAFFRTSDTVEDIETRRAELGIERLTIAASAYGAYVAQRYSDALQNIGPREFEAGVRGGGLRGGSFAIDERLFRLNRYEFVPGVRLSSRWRTETDRLGPLRIDGPGALDGVLRMRESNDVRGARPDRRQTCAHPDPPPEPRGRGVQRCVGGRTRCATHAEGP